LQVLQANMTDHSTRLRQLTAHIVGASTAATGTLLVANRGEIAIRICRAAAQLGIKTVAVYSTDDAACLHTRKADVAVELKGAGFGAAGYLNQAALLEVARAEGCTLVHCGYGFLSENPEFAAKVEAAGLMLVGPPSAAIALFGDKTRARLLAQQVGVPLLPGTTNAVPLGLKSTAVTLTLCTTARPLYTRFANINSVPLFLKRECDRTLGDARGGAGVLRVAQRRAGHAQGARGRRGARVALDVKIIKCPSPPNVLKNTYDHS
jgi:hypothetical protein